MARDEYPGVVQVQPGEYDEEFEAVQLTLEERWMILDEKGSKSKGYREKNSVCNNSRKRIIGREHLEESKRDDRCSTMGYGV